MSALIDLKGKTFERLTVLERVPDPTGQCRAIWKCQCVCGNIRNVFGRHLREKDTKSCGCYRDEVRVKNNLKEPYFWVYHQMRKTAHDTGKSCDITYQEFLEFTKILVCHYCKTPINWFPHRPRGVCGAYHIDRKDNSIGYTKENCVVCCSLCNHIKGHRLTYAEMLLLGPTISTIQQARASDIKS